jgi:hypothetical protein
MPRLRLLVLGGGGKMWIVMLMPGGRLHQNQAAENNANFGKKLHAARELNDGRSEFEKTTCRVFSNGLIFGKDVYWLLSNVSA